MPSTHQKQTFIRYWKDQTGNTEVDMVAVAKMAMEMGWEAPPPITAVDRLAQQFKRAARQDIRHDNKTGRPYRGYHAVPHTKSGQLSFSYIDIDDPNASPDSFRKACVIRREQSVDDQLQLRLDQQHWNDQRPPEQQVEILTADMEFDLEIKLAAMDAKDEAA